MSKNPVSPVLSSQVARSRTLAGMDRAAYLDVWRAELEAPLKGLSREERRYRFYTRYNWDRYERVREAYLPTQTLVDAVGGLSRPQTWLYLTETWCSDAAYSQPVIEAAAQAGVDITLRFLLRDRNLDVMERYLSHGARAIPVLVVFDASGNELVRWGSKPQALAKYRKAMMAEGKEGRHISAATIDWYEDKGWLEVERELTAAFRASGVATAA